jgi:hypothetical protein
MKRPDRDFVEQFLSATYELCLEMHQGDPVKARAEFDRVMDMTWEQLAEWHQEQVRALELADVRTATLKRLSRMKPGDVLHLSIGSSSPWSLASGTPHGTCRPGIRWRCTPRPTACASRSGMPGDGRTRSHEERWSCPCRRQRPGKGPGVTEITPERRRPRGETTTRIKAAAPSPARKAVPANYLYGEVAGLEMTTAPTTANGGMAE